jgi:hypothetical protein
MKKRFFSTAAICLATLIAISAITTTGSAKTSSKATNSKKFTFSLNKEKVTWKVKLPKGWYIAKDKAKIDTLRLGLSTRNIYNQKGDYVGYCGIVAYDKDVSKYQDVKKLERLYNQVALGNDYQFDVRSDVSEFTFKNLVKTKNQRVDLCGVYYSATVTEDEKEKTNYGILSCHNKNRAYVIFDIEKSATTLKQIKKMAKSLRASLD